MKSLTNEFRRRVEAFLKATGTKPTEFGRQAIGEGGIMFPGASRVRPNAYAGSYRRVRPSCC